MPKGNLEIESGYAAINGAQIYYEVSGIGHPIIFVHAGVADRRMWNDQFPVFAEYFRTIRFDQRGFGNSKHVPGEYASRDDLLALLDMLKVEHVHLIGCSMGGETCMDFALEHPDRASALVMVGSAPTGLELDCTIQTVGRQISDAELRASPGSWGLPPSGIAGDKTPAK